MKNHPPGSTASLGFGLIKPRRDKAAAKPSAEPQIDTPEVRSARILVVDDEAAMIRLMSRRLAEAGYEVKSVASAAAALEVCGQFKPDLIISDLCMTPVDGLGLLKEVQKRWPGLCVILQSAHGTIPAAVQATQGGAFGFLVKPVDRTELLDTVARALKVSTFAEAQGGWRAAIVSRSHLMEERVAQANLAARSEDPVLLTGEVGTGKELFARAIHEAGARRSQPFQTIDCRTLAMRPQDPAADPFPLAAEGTLLLEDIDALTPLLQGQLLAALRAGGGRARVRLISSTAHDLTQLAESGGFRDDLRREIGVITIEVPPLGRRREDIPLLIGHFLVQANAGDNSKKRYAPKAIELLSSRNWPGNVDQLRSVVKKSIALSPTQLMTVEFVKKCLDDNTDQPLPSFDEAREEFARNYLMQNLRITSGNVSQAARLAKRNRTDFYKLMTKHNVQPEEFKKPADK